MKSTLDDLGPTIQPVNWQKACSTHSCTGAQRIKNRIDPFHRPEELVTGTDDHKGNETWCSLSNFHINIPTNCGHGRSTPAQGPFIIFNPTFTVVIDLNL